MSNNCVMKVEVTDTFGGEANYCWVRRYRIVIDRRMTDLQVVRLAKKEAGWSGRKCNTEAFGDSFTLKPRGVCEVMFIDFE